MRDCNLSSQILKGDRNEQLNTPIFFTIGSSCIYASLAHQFNWSGCRRVPLNEDGGWVPAEQRNCDEKWHVTFALSHQEAKDGHELYEATLAWSGPWCHRCYGWMGWRWNNKFMLGTDFLLPPIPILLACMTTPSCYTYPLFCLLNLKEALCIWACMQTVKFFGRSTYILSISYIVNFVCKQKWMVALEI
jgi:hypothetical protein